jgi:hypothetical protein
MTFPPLLLRLRTHTPEHDWPTLWLPLFLVWPPLFLLCVPLALVGLLVANVLDPRQPRGAVELAGALFAVACALRGLHIELVGRRGQILISFH